MGGIFLIPGCVGWSSVDAGRFSSVAVLVSVWPECSDARILPTFLDLLNPRDKVRKFLGKL